jgi:hypothetical protein
MQKRASKLVGITKAVKKPTSAKVSIYAVFNHQGLDITREIEKLYEAIPFDYATSPTFQFIIPQQVMKGMILKYIESILF